MRSKSRGTVVFVVLLLAMLLVSVPAGAQDQTRTVMKNEQMNVTVSRSGNGYNISWSAPAGVTVERYELHSSWTGTSEAECGNKVIPCSHGGRLYTGRSRSYRHTGYPELRPRIYVVYAFYLVTVEIENMNVEVEHLHSYDFEHPGGENPTPVIENFGRWISGPKTATPPPGYPKPIKPTATPIPEVQPENKPCPPVSAWPSNVCGCYSPYAGGDYKFQSYYALATPGQNGVTHGCG